jgi:hypothetical protein
VCLAGRSALDKILALRGGAERVALNGVGAGLAVLVASALPVAVGVATLAWFHTAAIPPAVVAVACLAGWMGIVPGLLNNYWLGQERRGPMLALASISTLIVIAAALAAPRARRGGRAPRSTALRDRDPSAS